MPQGTICNLVFPLPLVSGLEGRLKHLRILNKVCFDKKNSLSLQMSPNLGLRHNGKPLFICYVHSREISRFLEDGTVI